jgi:hypothetical protein
MASFLPLPFLQLTSRRFLTTLIPREWQAADVRTSRTIEVDVGGLVYSKVHNSEILSLILGGLCLLPLFSVFGICAAADFCRWGVCSVRFSMIAIA